MAQQGAVLGPDLLRPALLSAAPGQDPQSFSASLLDACLAAASQESLEAAGGAFTSLMDAVRARRPAGGAGPAMASGVNAAMVASREDAVERSLAQAGVQAPLLLKNSVEERYLGKVEEWNKGQAASATSAGLFKLATEGADREDREVMRLWTLLRSMSEALRDVGGGSGPAAVLALARGARQSLEREHLAFVEKVVGRNREEARISGQLGPRSKVCGFVRARLRLPSDAALTSSDLLWQQCYLCLRSGLHQDALDLLRENEVTLRADELIGWLGEWVERGGVVRELTSSRLTERCHRLMSASAPMQTRNAHAVLIHVALSGDSDMHDRFLSEYRAFFSNIEDFLWFKLALVRTYARPAESTQFSVEEMQRYLNEFQPRHYSKEGKQPLLYAMVLLLSLQFHAAVDFLVHDPTSQHAYGADAVHLAIAMHLDGVLGACPPLEGVAPEGALRLRPERVVHAYASQQFLSRQRGDKHVEAALEYFVLASQMSEAPEEARASLLQELVTKTRAYGTLLGGGGTVTPSSLVARLAGPEGVQALVGHVAERCQEAAQNEAATELFLAAGRAEEALTLLVRRMSDLVASAPDSEMVTLTSTAEFQELVRRGKGACERVDGASQASEDFATLQTVAILLGGELCRDWQVALDALGRLHRYVPSHGHPGEADKCVRAVQSTPVVRGHLDDVLQAAARVLEAQVENALRGRRPYEVPDVRRRAAAMQEVAGSLKLHRACSLLTQLCTRLNNITA